MATPSPTQPWHVLSADDALSSLDTSSHGLSDDEAAARLAEHGPNEIRTAEKVRPLAIFLHQFTSPLIYVLLAAMVVTLVIGEFADAIVIALVLTLNAVIGFTQEYRAENAMQALMGLVTPRATVRRNGERVDVDSTELVPGDIVLLESGDLVPADVRLIDETELRVDDSILTGESLAVGKTARPIEGGADLPLGDRRNIAFMGTSVAAGRARGVVVATGSRTEIGRIAGAMRGTERMLTPLQARMHRFGNWLSVIIVTVSLVAFGVGLLQGISARDMFLTAVAIAVAAIPEGLPVVMTVALAVSVRRMAKRNAIIRRLPAVETLGSCSTIVSDKTGTLTENRMTVQAIWSAGSYFRVTGSGLGVRGSIVPGSIGPSVGADDAVSDAASRDSALSVDAIERDEPGLYRTLVAGVLANESDIRRDADRADHVIAQGDPTEIALLVAAAKAHVAREDLLDRYPQTSHVPFESERKFSATVHEMRNGDGRAMAFVKGAPERVLDMCEQMLSTEGATPIDRDAVLAAASELAGQGLRVLAMAAADSDEAVEATRHAEPRGLIFLGLVGMLDPPRPEVIEAIANCHRAGIRVIMCTGDHASTAAAIASRIRIAPDLPVDEVPRALTGADLLDMEDDDLRDALHEVRVFARVSPQQKLRIVTLLRDPIHGLGHVVAVTGDGVNDAPALKAAHIGCAMGISGTDVAKEASEMVLTDDNFATIYAAVEEGRTAFSNIRKATDFLLSTSVGVVMAIFGCFVFAAFGVLHMPSGGNGTSGHAIPLLLLPAQILWLNVVTNGIQDVALAFEPGERRQYRQPPRDPKEGLLSPLLVERTILVGILLAIVALAMFTLELRRSDDLAYAQCATLTAMVIFKMLHVGACRSETLSIFQKNVFSNPVLFIGTTVSLAVHLSALYFPPTQYLLGLEPLRTETWFLIVVAAPSVLVLVELHKLFRSPASPGIK